MKDVAERSGADIVIVEDLGDVETEDSVAGVPLIDLVVEEPAARIEPDGKSRREIVGAGAFASAQEVLDVGEAAFSEGNPKYLLDGVLDDLLLFRHDVAAVARPDEESQQVLQEVAILRGTSKLERIESRRFPGHERLVAPAKRTDEDFGAAVFVEKGATR